MKEVRMNKKNEKQDNNKVRMNTKKQKERL